MPNSYNERVRRVRRAKSAQSAASNDSSSVSSNQDGFYSRQRRDEFYDNEQIESAAGQDESHRDFMYPSSDPYSDDLQGYESLQDSLFYQEDEAQWQADDEGYGYGPVDARRYQPQRESSYSAYTVDDDGRNGSYGPQRYERDGYEEPYEYDGYDAYDSYRKSDRRNRRDPYEQPRIRSQASRSNRQMPQEEGDLLRRIPASAPKPRRQTASKRRDRLDERDEPRKKRGIPWILQGTLYAMLGALLGLFARYIDLHPGTDLINDLAVSLSDLPFWMMCAVGISVYSKNKFAAFVNVLLFFSFMDLAYYWYSWYFNGEALRRLFLFWGAAGACASLLAPFVHWAKSEGAIGMILSIAVLCVQTILTGWSVIGLNFLWFLGSVLFLHRRSLLSTLVMALCGGVLGIFGWMYIKEATNFSSLLRHASKDGQESDLLKWIKTVDPQILKNYLEPYLEQ